MIVPACASQVRLLYSPSRTRTQQSPLPAFDCKDRRPSLFCRSKRNRFYHVGPIIKKYAELPDDYRDEVGLAFRRADLSQGEVASIFGPKMDVRQANRLLRILHGRRVAGTLDDPNLQRGRYQSFHRKSREAALKYLRKTVPVDEVINAGLRAEDELQEIERENDDVTGDMARLAEEMTVVKGSRFSVYKNEEGGTVLAGKDIYGDSVLDRIRAANRAKAEEREQREEEERRLREEEEAKSNPGKIEVYGMKAPKALSPRLQGYTERAQSNLKEPPRMSTLARIGPTAVFVVTSVILLALYGENYRSPDWIDQSVPDFRPSIVTVGTLAIGNVLIFLLWKFPPAWRLLNRYMIFVPAVPKPISTLGAMFSQQSFAHLLSNVSFLCFFGVKLHEEIGRADFLATYFSSGLVGSLGTMIYLIFRKRLDLVSLGSSGAVYGIMAAYFWLHRSEGFKIFGLPPDPSNGVQGLGFLGLLLGAVIAGFFSKTEKLDNMGHLVGLVMGCVAASWVKWRGRGPEKDEKAAKEKNMTDRLVLKGQALPDSGGTAR
jgi:rhomboid-like protein